MGFFTNETKKKGTSSFFTSSNDYDIGSVQKSISNARLRILDSGNKVEDADSRNWFEKATNLPEKQNVLFDTLELLGRGGQAVMNPISKAIKGEDQNVASSFFKGLSGQERVRGSEIVEDLGVKNKIAKAVLGTGLEIGLDPTTYIPGGVLLRGAKVGAKTALLPLKGAYNLAEKVSPKLKTLREEVVQPALTTAKDKFGYAFKDDYKATETLTGGKSDDLLDTYNSTEAKRKYLQEDYANKLIKTAQTTGVEAGKLVGREMESGLRQFKDVKGYEFPDGLKRTTDKKDLIGELEKNRGEIRNIGKELSPTKMEFPDQINVGTKAFQLSEKNIPATKFKPAQIVLIKPKGAVSKEIEEIKDINGVKNYRFSGETAFVPETKIRPVGKPVLTESGAFASAISNTAQELEKVNRQLVKTFESQRNKKLKGLVKSQPNNKSVLKRGFTSPSPAINLLSQHGEEIAQRIKDMKIANGSLRFRKKSLTPEQMDQLATSRAFKSLYPSPAFNYLSQRRGELKQGLDSLRAEAKKAKETRVSAIGKLVEENEKVRTSLKNPVMMKEELKRPTRVFSTDTKIKKAAETLMKSNEEIRGLAASEGISIGEIEGYMAHILSQEEKKRRKINNPVLIDQGNKGLGQPNKGITKNREIMGSAEDINERLGTKKFEDNAYFSTAQGQRRMIDYIQSVSFRKNVLNDRNFARPYVKGDVVPNNAVVIDTNNYKFIKDSEDLMEGAASKDIGGQYMVTKATKQKLDKYKHSMTDEGSKAFLNAYDGLQSFWKRATLLSVPYHLRNDIGAKFNSWIGGMSGADLVKYSKNADIEVVNATFRGKKTPMYDEYLKQGLGATSQNQVEFAKRGADPDKVIEKMVKEGSKDIKGKVKDRLNPLRIFQTSQEIGSFVDQTNRYSVYLWARDKLKLSPADATKKVNEIQFDYSKLSNFERDFATRAFPFYRWMRNNLPFQIRQFAKDPRKYAGVNKLRLNAQDAAGINEQNVPDFMKEGFFLPVSSDGKGSGKMLGFNLPIGDLTKLGNPLKTLVDSTTQIAKLPLELSINRSLFFDKPIEKFKGQTKQFNVLGQEFNVAMKTAYALEQATGQIGRGVSGFLTKPEDEDQDTKFRMPSLGIKGVLKDFDANSANYFELRDKLKELQDYISYIEQQTGEKPRTINEIKKSNKSSFFS